MNGYVSLKQNIGFRRMYRRGRSYVSPCLVVYAMPNREGKNRMGITAGKKVGCAVKRNRAKRRIRPLFAQWIASSDLQGRTFDFVIVARARIVDAKYEKLRKDFYKSIEEVMKQFEK